ncbi:MAG: DAK2 domain-containing protein [Acidimicrobiales bacterium]|jgi:DAK2 domain fusion protein YloV|nr:DAK2 domain-containing protein [Acidimicrobiales bacterium]
MSARVLDGDGLRSVVHAFRDGLRAHREAINRLNVYPVPDGDTGTNMTLTVESVVAEVGDHTGLAEVCAAMAHGSLMGARGNSGVILSQILRGMTGVLREAPVVDGVTFSRALTAAASAAYTAVQRPVEGTILTVVRESAEAAAEVAVHDQDLVVVVDAALRGGERSLAATPELLPVLKQAGVVDAGGRGLLLLFDAFLAVADGRPMPEPEVLAGPAPHVEPEPGGIADLRYEVMFLLEADDERVPAFREQWAAIGDSIVVVGGEGLWNCHVHTDDIGAAIEAGIEAGRPRAIRVTDLLEEVEERGWVEEALGSEEPSGEPVTTAVVAVAAGAGVARILRSLGVHRVVTGGQTMNPSTAQLLEAVERVPAEQVVILPNNKNIVAVAEQVDGQTHKSVRVVATTCVPEGFAALLSYDPEADVEENAGAMRTALASIASGEVTVAVRDSQGDAGPIVAGDAIGLVRGKVRTVAPDVVGATTALLDLLVSDEHELVTLIEGLDARAEDTEAVLAWLAEHRPDVDVEVHDGGQPLYPYYLGVE